MPLTSKADFLKLNVDEMVNFLEEHFKFTSDILTKFRGTVLGLMQWK